jgi:hypothetical protein
MPKSLSLTCLFNCFNESASLYECQKIRDKKKDEYCIKNNIHLLRISHIENVNDKLGFI